MTKLRIYWNDSHPDKTRYTEIDDPHELIDSITQLVVYTQPTEYSVIPKGSILYYDVEEH